MTEEIALVVSVASVIVSLVVGLLPFTNRDLDRAKKCLDLRELSGFDPGDEYYDYLTESAKRSIFADSYRHNQKVTVALYSGLLMELAPLLGWLCSFCWREYLQFRSLFSLEFLISLVPVLICALVMALLLFRWRQSILYGTKKESDSIEKGIIRTKLKFLNYQVELVVAVAVIVVFSYMISCMSHKAGAVLCILASAILLVFTIFRKRLFSRWGDFKVNHAGKFWFELLFEDDYKIEDYCDDKKVDE